MSARKNRAAVAGVVGVLVTAAVAAGIATADHGATAQYRANLQPVPHSASADAGSRATGSVNLARRGQRVHVALNARGVTPRLPHAVHIHGKEAAGEVARCPGADRRDDLVDDGLIETAEGLEDYGPVLVSFTTRGDTSEKSILALDRFPVGRRSGTLHYQRTLTVPRALASRLDELHVVVHGHDLDRDGRYGGRTTALKAPLEGELPVACGRIVRK